ncbi:hypothetical protein Tco_0005116 [Tanacetum coccineum]
MPFGAGVTEWYQSFGCRELDYHGERNSSRSRDEYRLLAEQHYLVPDVSRPKHKDEDEDEDSNNPHMRRRQRPQEE